MNNAKKLLYYICVPFVNENNQIKKLKPFLVISLLIIFIVIILDFFLFEANIYVYLSISIIPIFILILKRFYFIYTINIIYFIFIIFPKIINEIGKYFQFEILTSYTIITILLKIFCFILLIISQYFFFLYYKELKYQYIMERPDKRYIISENNNESETEKFINKNEEILSDMIIN